MCLYSYIYTLFVCLFGSRIWLNATDETIWGHPFLPFSPKHLAEVAELRCPTTVRNYKVVSHAILDTAVAKRLNRGCWREQAYQP